MTSSLFLHQAYIGMGSNLGNCQEVLLTSWAWLDAVPGVSCKTLSSPYATEPVGMLTDHWFVNAVGYLTTRLSPVELLETLHVLEQRAGRVRSPGVSGYQDRTLDLDLLLFDELIVQTPDLSVPHPQITRRLFVLKPLSEICPDNLLHPLTGLSIHHHLRDCLRDNPNYHIRQMQWITD